MFLSFTYALLLLSASRAFDLAGRWRVTCLPPLKPESYPAREILVGTRRQHKHGAGRVGNLMLWQQSPEKSSNMLDE